MALSPSKQAGNVPMDIDEAVAKPAGGRPRRERRIIQNYKELDEGAQFVVEEAPRQQQGQHPKRRGRPPKHAQRAPNVTEGAQPPTSDQVGLPLSPSREPATKRHRAANPKGRTKRRLDTAGALGGNNRQLGASTTLAAAVGENSGAAAIGGEAFGTDVLLAGAATSDADASIGEDEGGSSGSWFKGPKGSKLYKLLYHAAYDVGVHDKTLEQFVELLKSPENAAKYTEINALMKHFKINTLRQAVTKFNTYFECSQKQQRGAVAFLKEMAEIREKQLESGNNKYLGMNITQLMAALKIEIEAGRSGAQGAESGDQQLDAGTPTAAAGEAEDDIFC
jgi:hypothetical protein